MDARLAVVSLVALIFSGSAHAATVFYGKAFNQAPAESAYLDWRSSVVNDTMDGLDDLEIDGSGIGSTSQGNVYSSGSGTLSVGSDPRPIDVIDGTFLLQDPEIVAFLPRDTRLTWTLAQARNSVGFFAETDDREMFVSMRGGGMSFGFELTGTVDNIFFGVSGLDFLVEEVEIITRYQSLNISPMSFDRFVTGTAPAAVPLPAGLPLLVLGFTVLSAFGRRNRRG